MKPINQLLFRASVSDGCRCHSLEAPLRPKPITALDLQSIENVQRKSKLLVVAALASQQIVQDQQWVAVCSEQRSQLKVNINCCSRMRNDYGVLRVTCQSNVHVTVTNRDELQLKQNEPSFSRRPLMETVTVASVLCGSRRSEQTVPVTF
jgi:hypothetical protein